MKRKRRARIATILAFICLPTLLGLYLWRNLWSVMPPPPLNRVAAWMPSSWDNQRAYTSWRAHQAHIQELSPVWYQLDRSGSGALVPYAGARDHTLVEEAHANGTLIIPLVNNYYADTNFDPAPVGAVIYNAAQRTAHIEALVDEVLAYDYDGIEIDYESLNGMQDREAFSIFIEELANALHAHGRLLSVAIHPKTAEPGPWEAPQAQDWARIGAAADRFRIMAYGYHWAGGDPGPIAPLWWMEEVLDLATALVPYHKVYVGLHCYGLDWSASGTSSLTWDSAQEIIAAYGIQPQWEHSAGWRSPVAEPWFTYTDAAGIEHEVWYADQASIAARLALVEDYGLGGVALWRLGGEDPAIWEAIAVTLPATETPLPEGAP